MNVKRNYQKELEEILKVPQNKGKRLFLHSCCAPCSSYCLEYLRKYFEITIFYYNPNITLPEEYAKRVAEQQRLIKQLNAPLTGQEETAEGSFFSISFMEGEYCPEEFFSMAKGHEQDIEGGERCLRCYELRLRKACEMAASNQFDYVTTTLSISPMKNAAKLNEIGEKVAKEYNIAYLPSDFKKKDGYKRSIELSREYDLYRQDYCGCIYSKVQREQQNSQQAVEKIKEV